MTACSNRKGRAGRVITAALVGALSVGAPAVALATGGVDLLASDQENWDQATFTFDHEPGEDGKSYAVTSGDVLSFVGGTDGGMNAIAPSDVTVMFFNRTDTAIKDGDKVTSQNKGATIDNDEGTMPTTPGKYWVVVFDGDVAMPEADTDTFGTIKTKASAHRAFALTVNAKGEGTSLEGAEAYESGDLSDTSFSYSGNTIKVSLKVDGEQVDLSKVKISWLATPKGAATPSQSGNVIEVTNAGTYTALVSPKGNTYTGSAKVTFEVKAVDLSSTGASIDNVDTTKGLAFSTTNVLDLSKNPVKVDGVTMSGSAVKATLVMVNDAAFSQGRTGTEKTNGKYTFKVEPAGGASSDDIKGSTLVDVYVVNSTVTYEYDGKALATAFATSFKPSKGTSFNPALLTATVGSDDVDFTVKVTKDGEEVTSYDEPGTYKVTLETAPVKDSDGKYLYAGHAEDTFKVESGVDYSDSKMYVSRDGKNLKDNASIPYTGKAIEPTVVVRDKKGNVLTEGEDYTLKFTDAKGNEIESATEVGDYKIEVKFVGDENTKLSFSFKITKATIASAAATAEYFAIPADGSAVTPTFYGYTEADQKGDKFELASDEISVKYYEAKGEVKDGKFVLNSSNPKGDSVKADELNEDGYYVANVTILNNAKCFNGGVVNTDVLVHVTKTAVYTDVDANAWYGKVVYDAKDLGYMSGITGTSLFMPTATISRAEVAAVMFNMAGGEDDHMSHPTRFTDVPEDSWFAQAADWASRSGVMGGYTGTDSFGSYDATTREQVAAILYNYAKAQGKDVSVKDADAALAKFDDASEVSAWAKTAVAWAVENGVLGNGGYIGAKDTITRAEMAAMAVNFQPEKLDEPWA